MFGKEKAKRPEVELFEVIGDGASFAWDCVESRALALEVFVELARRLEGQDTVRRLRLSGLIGSPIDVADIGSFVEAAPELLDQQHQAYEFEFRLNDGERPYRVRHLDQGVTGIAFRAPVERDVFWSGLKEVLEESRNADRGVTFSTGLWL